MIAIKVKRNGGVGLIVRGLIEFEVFITHGIYSKGLILGSWFVIHTYVLWC